MIESHNDSFTRFPLVVKYPKYTFQELVEPDYESSYQDNAIHKNIDQTLMQIDPLLERSEYDGHDIKIKMTNLSREQPVNLLGRGFQKTIRLLRDMYSDDHSVLLVDEVENGMDYQTIETVFDKICHIIKHENYEKQLFVTTHSYEVIKAIHTLMQKYEKYAGLFSVYTIRKYENGHHVFFHDKDSIEYAVEYNEELR